MMKITTHITLYAILTTLSLVVITSGCKMRTPHPTKPYGSPIPHGTLDFRQDGLHNCGCIAMLISWANLHPKDANNLVFRQTDNTYIVAFKTGDQVRVTPNDLALARNVRLLHPRQGDIWAKVVLTAFAKYKCAPHPLDFKQTEWIDAGEIAYCLTGTESQYFEIKPATEDDKGQIKFGKPIPISALKTKMNSLRGKPLVAYTKVHIWAVLDYDPTHSRVRVRNPRSQASKWLSTKTFHQKFAILVYVQ